MLLSAFGLVGVVFGMLQSKTWGWIVPLHSPEVNGVEIAPLGISLTAWFIVLGVVLLVLFFARQRALVAKGREPLVHVDLLSIRQLRSGLSVLGGQYAIIAGLFFMVPVYLQMTLGFNAIETGIRIFPLSVSLILFSIFGTRLSTRWSARRVVRVGQWILVASSILLLTAIDPELSSPAFGIGMFSAGAGLGLLASQLGNVNMSSVTAKDTSEVGGLQGVFQNLGSSLGTALIGSILIGALASSFASGVAQSTLPDETQAIVNEQTEGGVAIVPASTVQEIAQDSGLTAEEAVQLEAIYIESQLSSLRTAFFGLILLALLSVVVSGGIPNDVPERRPSRKRPPPPQGSGDRLALERVGYRGTVTTDAASTAPPVAARNPVVRSHHGDDVEDAVRVVPRQGGCGGHRPPRGGERLHEGAHRAPGRPSGDDLRTRSRDARSRPTSRSRRDAATGGTTAEPSRASSTASSAARRSPRPTTGPRPTSPATRMSTASRSCSTETSRRGSRVLLARQLRGDDGRRPDAVRRGRRRRRALHRARARPRHR